MTNRWGPGQECPGYSWLLPVFLPEGGHLGRLFHGSFKKGSPGDTPGPWGENITGTLFHTAVLELNQLFTICHSPIQLVDREGAPWGRDKEQPSPLDQRYIIKHLSLEPLALVNEQ